jgi:AcrR family transcriptional regulator
MPPKFKFEKSEIIQAALEVVREHGWKGLTARSIAKVLDASSKPIYSYFSSVTALEEEVVKKAVELLYKYMTKKRTGDPWHDHGIGYVLFGLEEKKLFMAVNDDMHVVLFRKYGKKNWDACITSLADYPPFKGLTEEQIFKIQLHRWLLAHGLAFQAAVQPPGLFDVSRITEIIREGSVAILDGLKLKSTNN